MVAPLQTRPSLPGCSVVTRRGIARHDPPP